MYKVKDIRTMWDKCFIYYITLRITDVHVYDSRTKISPRPRHKAKTGKMTKSMLTFREHKEIRDETSERRKEFCVIMYVQKSGSESLV